MSDTSSQGKGFFVGHGWMKGDTEPPPTGGGPAPTLTSIMPDTAVQNVATEIHFHGTGITPTSKLRVDAYSYGSLYTTYISDTEMMFDGVIFSAIGDFPAQIDNEGVLSNTMTLTVTP